MVVKGREWERVNRILVPTAGGPHAPIAAQLAMLLSESYGSQVTSLYVQLGRATPEQMEENRRRIAQTLAGLGFSHPPEQKVVIADSMVEGIVREAEGYDLVLLGASEEGLFDQFVFGSIPQQIAARASKTAVIVRHYGGPAEFWARKLMRGLYYAARHCHPPGSHYGRHHQGHSRAADHSRGVGGTGRLPGGRTRRVRVSGRQEWRSRDRHHALGSPLQPGDS